MENPTLRAKDKLSAGPYAPNGKQLMWFWLAGPLTLVLFTPLLLAGVFGAPAMPFGMIAAWWMLKTGRDEVGHFALAGLLAAMLALPIVWLFARGLGQLYLFGLGFGPVMAMMFRGIAGSWREPTARSDAHP